MDLHCHSYWRGLLPDQRYGTGQHYHAYFLDWKCFAKTLVFLRGRYNAVLSQKDGGCGAINAIIKHQNKLKALGVKLKFNFIIAIFALLA
jgi:hypothetical protein